jgi:hypothetical protein
MNTEFQTNVHTCNDFFEMMEDTVTYFTEEYGLSAELAYSMIQDYGQIKTSKLKEMTQMV